MPMFTTSVMGLSVRPVQSPSRTRSEKPRSRASTSRMSGITSSPSTVTGSPERFLSAVCSAGRARWGSRRRPRTCGSDGPRRRWRARATRAPSRTATSVWFFEVSSTSPHASSVQAFTRSGSSSKSSTSVRSCISLAPGLEGAPLRALVGSGHGGASHRVGRPRGCCPGTRQCSEAAPGPTRAGRARRLSRACRACPSPRPAGSRTPRAPSSRCPSCARTPSRYPRRPPRLEPELLLREAVAHGVELLAVARETVEESRFRNAMPQYFTMASTFASSGWSTYFFTSAW